MSRGICEEGEVKLRGAFNSDRTREMSPGGCSVGGTNLEKWGVN